jgi:hypothetical protein
MVMLSHEIIYQLIVTNLLSHLPIAFLFGIIILNNIVFGYILMSDCFLKSDESDALERY